LRVLEDAIAQWGYLAIFVGTALEGEAILLVGAAMAHRGLLSLPWVALSALIGSVFADQLWFLVGQRAGRGFITARPRLAVHVAAVERWIARWGMLFVLSFRFLYGLRTISPVILGATGYPRTRFVVLNIVGAALWALSFALIGYGLGAALTAVLGRAHRLEEAAAVGAVIACALVLIARRRERRVAAQPSTVKLPERTEEAPLADDK
jgi:membrane protein DedA with SNARE-associated domain